MKKSRIHSFILIVFSFFVFSTIKRNYLSQKTQLHAKTMTLPAIDENQSQLSPLKQELNNLLKQNQTLSRMKLDKENPINYQEITAIKKIITKASLETNIPPVLVHAICKVESQLDPQAFKRNDGGKKNHAIGMCQILRRTGEMLLKTKDKGCLRNYNRISKTQRIKKNCFLFDPYLNAKAAALYLKDRMRLYNTLEQLIASYNSGSIKRNSRGQLINQNYVNKVYNQLYVPKPLAQYSSNS